MKKRGAQDEGRGTSVSRPGHRNPPLAIALGLGAMVRGREPAGTGRPGVAPAKPLLVQTILIAGLIVFAAAERASISGQLAAVSEGRSLLAAS